MFALLAVVCAAQPIHLEAEVPLDGGDFVEVPFDVPDATREIRIAHTDGDDSIVLDWGVWGPDGFRGWGGGNTEDAVIGVEESSRSYRTGAITPGTWTIIVGKANIGPGARYSIDVTCLAAPTLAPRPRAPFTPAVLSSERRWYKGDFHVHSSESGDANASFDQIAELAQRRGLDFVNLSDHNTDSQIALAAAAQSRYADVLFLRGAEITTYAGHGNAVGLPSYVDHRIGFQGRTIAQILDDVAAQNALFIVNHPTLALGDLCIGCAWDHPTTPWDKVAGLEVITGRWDVVEPLFVPSAIKLWDQLADQGFRIAAIGGSDDHRAGTGTGTTDTPIGSPTTLVLADSLSEAALVDGIRRGRTIVQLRGPDDPLVQFQLAGADIGDTVDNVETAELDVTITGGAGTLVQLWRDGVRLAQQPVTSDSFTHRFTDAPGAADRRYRVELISELGQRIVVTSHIYVHGVEPSGCGCHSSGAALASALPVLLLVLRRRRRESRSVLAT